MVGRIAKVLLTTAVMALAVATEGSAASPIHYSVSGMIGGTSSEVAATGLMADYFAPTARTEATRSLRGGVECEALLWKWLGVSLGARYQQAGQHTRTTTVLYADDVFPHEFTSSIRMDYVAVPLCLKAGISAKRGWILARAGVSPAYLLHSKAAWTIDGVRVEPGTMRMPDVRIDTYDMSLIVGAEAGIRLRNNGVFALVQYDRGVHNIASGLSGKAYNRSAGFCAGYRRFF